MNNFIKKIIEKDLKEKKIKKLHTRFPPEPNGYLHIGHAKSICLNFGLAKKYEGKCNLRFDDTNPNSKNKKYIKYIKKDIKWLGFKWHGATCYSSKYFKILYKYALKLIKKKLAYVDEMSHEEIKYHRGTLNKKGINSPYRNRCISENLSLFEKMKKGYFSEGKACLRAKIDMSSPIILMRDPILYRIKFTKHHKTKNKWCIYPMYDFAHCISDYIEKITHSLCTSEFSENRYLYEWILKNIEVKNKPKQYEFSRLKLEYTVLSKRKIQTLINNNIIKKWNDPRIFTISSLRNKGYTPYSIRKFCNVIGITRKDHMIQMSSLENCIKKELNLKSPRIMAVVDPIKIVITNLPKNHVENINFPNHPNRIDMGFRKSIFSNVIYIEKNDFSENNVNKKYRGLILNGEIRLRYSYIIKCNKVLKNKKNKIIKLLCTYDKTTLNKNPKNRSVKGVIHWLSSINCFIAQFNFYERLFNIKNPDSKKYFLNFINNESIIIKKGYVERGIKNIKEKKRYQFERIGYFYLKKIKNNHVWKFNRIVELKNTKK
ncbi:glutamine--tRNA ligase [Buchnera aphidicola (Taiwanaphis decaspermi)]|uniref:glutamine--tRNA ligase n=1 Tax=Buchnera aphidicola TaxID=9 RepID=UPI0031B84C11